MELEIRKRSVDIFFHSLETKCKDDNVNCDNFKIEIFNDTNTFTWFFNGSRCTSVDFIPPKDVKFSLKLKESTMDKLILGKISLSRAFLTRKIRYSGSYSIFKHLRPQIGHAVTQSFAFLKDNGHLTEEMLNNLTNRFQNIKFTSNKNANEKSSGGKYFQESERFLKSFFENQLSPIRANSITVNTSSLVIITSNLIAKVRKLQKKVNAIEANTFFASLKTIFANCIIKLCVLVPLVLCWKQIDLFNHASEATVFTHLAFTGLCLCFKKPVLLILSRRIVAGNFSIASLIAIRHYSVMFKALTLCNILLNASRLLFARQILIYSSALTIIFSYFFVMIFLEKILKWKGSNVEHIYQNMHYIFAPFACKRVIQLRSVFVKFGQYLGGRADFVPKEWNEILAKLQDDMPPARGSYIRNTLETTLGKSIKDIFYELSYEPIASASVAQVHEGYLRSTNGGRGMKVALKIQHEGIEELIKSDMVAFKRLVKLCGYLNAKFKPTYGMLCAWEREIMFELDFRTEAKNICTVRDNFKELNLIANESPNELSVSCEAETTFNDVVLVPQLIKGFTNKTMFVMNFVDGFKITNLELLHLYQVDRVLLMQRLVQVYGAQMFVKGTFNADPHAGNILVNIDNKGQARPVLLDFGMVIKLSETERLGYCELVYALSQLSVSNLSASLKKIGYANSQSHIHPERDLEFFAYLLRPTAGRAKSMRASKNFRSHRVAQRRNDLSGKREDLEESIKEGRYFKEFPEKLMFLFRVLGLIRGLCSVLDVQLDYISIFSDYARYALLGKNLSDFEKNINYNTHTTCSVYSTLSRRNRLIQQRFYNLNEEIEALYTNSAIMVGAQVSVVYNNIVIASFAKGEFGKTNQKKVTHSSLFPMQELSSLLSILAILRLLSQEKLHLLTDLHKVLPMLPPDSISVTELLSYSAKLEELVPKTTTPAYLAGITLENLFDSLKLPSVEGSKSTVFTHVLLMQLLIEKITGMTLQQYLESEILNPLGVDGISLNRLPGDCVEASNGVADMAWGMISSYFFKQKSNNSETKTQMEEMSLFTTDLSGIPVDLCIVNSSELNSMFFSPIGAFATAFSVNLLFRKAFKNLISKDLLCHLFKAPVSKEVSALMGERNWSLGLQLENLNKNPILLRQGFGGNLFLVCPNVGLFLTILVNNYTIEKNFTKDVVRLVLEKIQVDVEVNSLFNGII